MLPCIIMQPLRCSRLLHLPQGPERLRSAKIALLGRSATAKAHGARKVITCYIRITYSYMWPRDTHTKLLGAALQVRIMNWKGEAQSGSAPQAVSCPAGSAVAGGGQSRDAWCGSVPVECYR